MIPKLNGIDHVHVYVSSWSAAEAWYKSVLGFKRVEKLMVWAVENGPLTIEDPGGNIHLALFESDKRPNTTIAFGVNSTDFLAWKAHLESHALELRIADHKLSWSLYFSDPFGNLYEITTYDYELVAKQVA